MVSGRLRERESVVRGVSVSPRPWRRRRMLLGGVVVEVVLGEVGGVRVRVRLGVKIEGLGVLRGMVVSEVVVHGEWHEVFVNDGVRGKQELQNKVLYVRES